MTATSLPILRKVRPVIVVSGKTWITATEAHEYLGADVTAGRVRDWARAGKCTGHRVGREVYYDLEELTEVEHATRTSTRGHKRGVVTRSPHPVPS